MKEERYIYYATEHSVDVRNFRVTSKRQLSKDQLMMAICLPDIQKPQDVVTENDITATYTGTDYGDDCQFFISEGDVKEDDYAKSLF